MGFRRYKQYTEDEFIDALKHDTTFGLAKVDITPPKGLYVPVLPDNSKGKLLFHLEPMVARTWTTIELKKAVEKGYTITKVYSVLEYPKLTGLMRNYVGNFLKMKIENSGVKTLAECNDINESHKKLGFDFVVSPENCHENPGLRQLAKICLNSLWGKFAQRSNLSSYDFVKDYNMLICKLNDPTTASKNWHIINENTVELRYENLTDYNIEAEYISEITGVFTTANARMRLYNMLEWLDPSQICYCDTDSVMFVYDKNNSKHKEPLNDKPNEEPKLPIGLRFGKGLGEWEDEMKEGDWIVELVVGGAKSYAYRTHKGKIVVKQKGITLDHANETRVNFESIKQMVLNQDILNTCKSLKIKPSIINVWGYTLRKTPYRDSLSDGMQSLRTS